MANKFYEPGPQRAAHVQDLFAVIAGRYDLINDLQSLGLHRFWKRRLVRLAGARPGVRVLDLCCGTGDIAFRFAREGAQVVGVDFSGPMLAIARSRGERQDWPVEFINGDALNLPFASAVFDVVTVGYGLRNLSDFERGLREMWRVLRPGGHMLVLDFGKPQNAFFRAGYFTYLERVVPWFGRVFCGDAAPYQYISESLRHYPAQEGVARLMHGLGCEDVKIRNLLGGIMSINSARKPFSTPEKG